MGSVYIDVDIVYRDDKTETFACTDYPSAGGDWVVVYNGIDRTYLPSDGIKRVTCRVICAVTIVPKKK